MLCKLFAFYFFIHFSFSQRIPCTTCSTSNSKGCCQQYKRCCDEEIEKKGTCPSVFLRCTYKCTSDNSCTTNEKCCSNDPSFPKKVCIKTIKEVCPKSVSKSAKLKPCQDQNECSDGELCCIDPRNTGCCLKYTKDTSIIVTTTTKATTVTEETATEEEETATEEEEETATEEEEETATEEEEETATEEEEEETAIEEETTTKGTHKDEWVPSEAENN
uniref:WAP domain-containing protein n=1 Tax=Strigamia maritima TaxID=126957 RepID=T1JG99_STRMM